MKISGPAVRQVASITIGILFIFFIEHYLGWTTLLQPWAKASLPLLLLALFTVFSSYVLRSVRLYHYFQPQLAGQFLASVKLMLQHNFLNNLLPMRTGEIAFPLLMQSFFRIPMATSIAALLWFRLLDLHILVGVALASVLWPLVDSYQLFLFALFWLVCPLMFYLGQNALVAWINAHSNIPVLLRPLPKLIDKLAPGLPKNIPHFIWCWVWTITNWGVKLMAFSWILLIFVDTAFTNSLLGVIGGELTSVLPVHGVAGLGTYEAGIVAALASLNIDQKQALTGAVNTHLFLLSVTLLSGLISLTIKTQPRSNKLDLSQLE